MNEERAAAALRLSIRAVIGAPANGASLRNIITNIYPDGALCFVLENRGLYQLDKGSTATADNLTIVQPIGGPGRWILLGQGGGASSIVSIVGTATNDAITASPNFGGIDSANFAFQPAGAPAGWTLTAAGGILTYGGTVSVNARATFTGSVFVDEETGGTVWGAVALNDDLIGTDPTVNFLPGTQTTEAGATGLPQVIVSQRTLTIAPGDELRIVLATDTAEDLVLSRATLSIQLA